MKKNIVILAIFAAGVSVFADTLDVSPIVAGSIFQQYPTTSYVAQDRGYTFIGMDTSTTRANGLWKFDITSIPDGATITSATLYAYVQAMGTATSAPLIRLYQSARDWNYVPAGDGSTSATIGATWNDYYRDGTTSSAWAYPGGNGTGDRVSSSVYEVFDVGMTTGYKSVDVTDFVESWYNGTVANNGFWVYGDSDPGKYRQFYGTHSVAPMYITVEYTVPEPATIGILAAGGIFCFLKNTRRC